MCDEVQTLKFRQEFLTHVGFQHICVIAAPYSKSQFPWSSIKAHVMGAWEKNNDSFSLQLLRQQILHMQRAHDQVISPADIGKNDFRGITRI
jgi:hypothetical protein